MGQEVSFEVRAQGAYDALLTACARGGQVWRGTGALNKSRVRGSSPALHETKAGRKVDQVDPATQVEFLGGIGKKS